MNAPDVQIHPTLFALRATLAEYGIPLPPPQTEYALGRLMALEFASQLGIREARRVLALERSVLRTRCFREAEPG